jgi:hypothetical protein
MDQLNEVKVNQMAYDLGESQGLKAPKGLTGINLELYRDPKNPYKIGSIKWESWNMGFENKSVKNDK